MIEQEYYDYYADTPPEDYIKQYLLNDPSQNERFKAIIAALPSETKTVLDVGCGAGIILKLLVEQRPDISAIGLERSRITAETGRRMFGVDIRDGSADDLPFADNSFDTVVSCEVIEHLPYGVYERVLSEMERVAQNNIIITVPFKEKRHFLKCPYCSCSFPSYFHMRSFDVKDLQCLFNHAQFSKLEMIGISTAMPQAPEWLRRVLRSRSSVSRLKLPKYAICPQCGYRETPGSRGKDVETSSSLSWRIGKFCWRTCWHIAYSLFNRRRARWALSVYRMHQERKRRPNTKPYASVCENR